MTKRQTKISKKTGSKKPIIKDKVKKITQRKARSSRKFPSSKIKKNVSKEITVIRKSTKTSAKKKVIKHPVNQGSTKMISR